MMELYFYEDCEYSQIVLNTIYKLKIQDKFSFKDIRLNPDYAEELEDLTGDITVPCLVNAEGSMKEAKDIRKYLVSCFT
jgi:glutaredoxin 2